MIWDVNLEGPAYEIAASEGDILRVQAGPGTGKTFALMRRVTRLLEEGIDPLRILVCTLTRTAASDLVRKVTLLGAPGATRVKVGTLHAFCFGLLAKNSVLELTERVPRPLLEFEERFLIEDLCRDFGGVYSCKRYLKAFSAAWARLQAEAPGWPEDEDDRRFQNVLERWLEFHSAMLLGEIVPVVLRYLQNNPAAPERTHFKYVLVDEYQDLNRADQKVLDLLASGGRLAVVGDCNQSIYSFRFAHPEGICEFGSVHPGTMDYSLHECRRCPKRIVDMANSLISNNETRWEEVLESREDCPEGEIHVVQWPNVDLEGRGLALFVRKKIEDGTLEPGKILVLTPRKQLGYSIRDALGEASIPAHSFFREDVLGGNPKETGGCEAQKAYSLLCLLNDPEDTVALRCWCGYECNSLCAPEWGRLRAYCEQSGYTAWQGLREIMENRVSLPYTNRLCERKRLLDERLHELNGLTGEELLDAILPRTCDWAQSLRKIAESSDEDDYDAGTLRDILRMGVIQMELPTDVDYVRVMSLYKAKGLDADLVVLAGCVETLLPHIDRSLSQEEQRRSLEEQRRLFYVAITRTRKILVLSSAITMERGAAYQMRARVGRGDARRGRMVASRFIGELGEECPDAERGDEWLRRVIGE